MNITVNNQTLLSELRKDFKSVFPYLDIAFFSVPHSEGGGSPKKNQLDYHITAGEAGNPEKTGELHLSPLKTSAQIESDFEDQFGLYVQVLRKSGDVWLQTITSDELTLGELNQKAQIDNETSLEGGKQPSV